VLLDHRREQPGEVCVSGRELGYEGADLHVAFPAGIAPFDRGARAKDFVHGGNSLQERVIPVITVRHRHAAGGEKVTYEVTTEAGPAVAGMHHLRVVVRPARQTNLAFGTQPEVELALDCELAEAIQLELCDVHHARRAGAGVTRAVCRRQVAPQRRGRRISAPAEMRRAILCAPRQAAVLTPSPEDGAVALPDRRLVRGGK